jgi:hypothetical protein
MHSFVKNVFEESMGKKRTGSHFKISKLWKIHNIKAFKNFNKICKRIEKIPVIRAYCHLTDIAHVFGAIKKGFPESKKVFLFLFCFYFYFELFLNILTLIRLSFLKMPLRFIRMFHLV